MPYRRKPDATAESTCPPPAAISAIRQGTGKHQMEPGAFPVRLPTDSCHSRPKISKGSRKRTCRASVSCVSGQALPAWRGPPNNRFSDAPGLVDHRMLFPALQALGLPPSSIHRHNDGADPHRVTFQNFQGLRCRNWNMNLLALLASHEGSAGEPPPHSPRGRGDPAATPKTVAGITGGGWRPGSAEQSQYYVSPASPHRRGKRTVGKGILAEEASPGFPAKGAPEPAAVRAIFRQPEPECRRPAGWLIRSH